MGHPLPPEHESVSTPANNVVAVAIAKNKNSQNAARWAINNLLIRNANSPALLLIHVKKQNGTFHFSRFLIIWSTPLYNRVFVHACYDNKINRIKLAGFF